MTVSTIASLTAGVSTALGKTDPKLASSIRSLFESSKSSSNEEPLSVATSVQSQVASLKIAARNVAQASTQISIAQRGADEIGTTVDQLQRLATQAADPATTDEQRVQLDRQFQQLRQQVSSTVNSTSFGGQSLLDGKTSALTGNADGSSGFTGLTDKNIFGGKELNLRSAAAAQSASATLSAAQTYVTAQRAALTSLSQGVDVASATVQTALQNQDAARSTFDENDFTAVLLGAGTVSAKPDLLATYSEQSLRAQSNRLPPSLVTLLNE